MAKLIYSALTSLDGYVADEDGNFDWAKPSEEVHVFVNDLERPVGTYLYGRRMYEVMAYWETADTAGDQPPFFRDYAKIWKAAEKIVYSRTLAEVSSARTRIERQFDIDAIRHLFEVTASLDSQILGETEILKQSKDAYRIASENSSKDDVVGALLKLVAGVGN